MKLIRIWGGILLSCIGCVDIQEPLSPPIEARNVFAEFHFTSDAMMTRVGDTLQLSLKAVAIDGSPLQIDLQKVQWKSLDSVRVYVDTFGRVVAKTVVTLPVEVQATYTSGTSTRTAVIPVYVTASEVLSASSLRIVVLDSTRVGYGDGPIYPRIRLDLYDGVNRVRKGVQLPVTIPIPFKATYVQTGGPEQEPVYFVSNGGARLGKFWVKSFVNLYGVEVADSVEFTGTYPFMASWTLGEDSAGNPVSSGPSGLGVTAPCGVIRLMNFGPRPIEVVFNDSGSNIGGCGALPQNVLAFYGWIFPVFDAVGDSVITVPSYAVGIRRSATRGEVSWYLRDPVTKERLPVSGFYNSIHTE